MTMNVVAPSIFNETDGAEQENSTPSVSDSVRPVFYLNSHLNKSNILYEINKPTDLAIAVLCLSGTMRICGEDIKQG